MATYNVKVEVDDSVVSLIGHDFVLSVLGEKQREAEVLISKQADYGPKNISSCPLGPIPGIIVRLFDKISRLTHLSRSGVSANHEALEDTTLDIANYGTIGTLVLRGEWPQ